MPASSTDLLQDYEEKIALAPAWVRLIGILRIPIILFTILFLIAMIFSMLDSIRSGQKELMVGFAIVTLLFGTTLVFALYYSIKQMRYELSLNSRCYAPSKYRWTSNAVNIFLIIAIIATFVAFPEAEVSKPFLFVGIFSFFAAIALIVLIADIRYYMRINNLSNTKKTLSNESV